MAVYMSTPQENLWNTSYMGWGGLNVEDLSYKLNERQSPDLLNVRIKNGTFGKRKGQEYYTNAIETIYAMYIFKDSLYIHAGSHFYVRTSVTNGIASFEQKGSVSSYKGQFFAFNNHLYYINGHDYKVLGDNGFEDVTAYIPNIIINRKPSKEDGTLTDNYNRLGTKFRNSFSGDGEGKTFILTDGELDSTETLCVVDGVEKTEGTDYTINRTTGIVTFTTAPSVGTNNVVIEVSKTNQEYIDSIKHCTFARAYGGENNSRIFLGGSGANYYYSGVLDPTYFPDNNYSPVGNNSGKITGFGEQYDVLVVFTDHETYGLEYNTNADGIGYFTQVNINSSVGCDCPNTIQLVQNKLVWCNTYGGVYTMVSTAIEDERNIMPISRNINPMLLKEANLENAVSIDADENYMLSVNGHVYSWNYGVSPYTYSGNSVEDAKALSWFYYTNIPSNCFIEEGKELYYGRNNRIVHFADNLTDFGSAIEAHYQTPALNFDRIDYLKTVSKMFVSVRGDRASRIYCTYKYDNTDKEETEPLVLGGELWTNFSPDNFSIEGSARYAQTFRRKCKVKKFRFMSVLFENNNDNQDMNISELTLYYRYAKIDKGA